MISYKSDTSALELSKIYRIMKRKYGGQRRRTFKRRKITRRKTRRTSFINSTSGRPATSLYRTRRMPYRRYKRQMYKSLIFEEKYRSVFSGTATLVDTPSSSDKKFWYRYQLPDNFYLTAGGFTGSQTFTTSKFTIKGGLLSTTLRNETADTVIVEWGTIRFRNSLGEADVNAQETSCLADISNFDNFGTGFSLQGKMRRVVVEPNGQIEMRIRIPFTNINDITQWNTEGYAKTAIVYSIFPNSTSALNISRVVGHNLTFCADAIA